MNSRSGDDKPFGITDASEIVPIAEGRRSPRRIRRASAMRTNSGVALDTLAWAALDLGQAATLGDLLEDLEAMVHEVVDAGTSHVYFVERDGMDPSRWELVEAAPSVLLVSLNMLLDRHPHFWQSLVLGRHIEIGAGDDRLIPDVGDEDEEPRSYMLLVPMRSRAELEAVLCLEVPYGKPKPSPVQLLHLRQLCQQAAAPLARLAELERLENQLEALRHENERLRHENAADRSPGPEDEAETRLAIKNHVLGNFAHDLGTPAVAIRGYSRMILDGRAGPINSTQREYLEIVAANAARMVNLVHSMNHPIFGANLRLESFDLVELWRECSRRMEPHLRAKSITIEEKIPPDRPCVVTAEREGVAEVLDKLLANSVKFTSPGGSIAVSFSHNHRGEIAVRFSDTGVGVASDLLQKVFNYEAANNGAFGTEHPDSLATVRDFVRAQGGRIWASGGVGEGPTFELALLASEELHLEGKSE